MSFSPQPQAGGSGSTCNLYNVIYEKSSKAKEVQVKRDSLDAFKRTNLLRRSRVHEVYYADEASGR